MSESEIQQLIQIEGPQWHCQLMRNNSGALKDQTGRVVRFGLGNVSKKHNDRIKSSDLIGFTVVQVTPEMVGKHVAVFTAVEVKEPGWILSGSILNKREVAQRAFMGWVTAAGGLAGFADSIDSFKRILGVR